MSVNVYGYNVIKKNGDVMPLVVIDITREPAITTTPDLLEEFLNKGKELQLDYGMKALHDGSKTMRVTSYSKGYGTPPEDVKVSEYREGSGYTHSYRSEYQEFLKSSTGNSEVTGRTYHPPRPITWPKE
jgi:hypothetical protein